MDGREDDAERRRLNRQGGQPKVFVLHRHRAGTCARREQVREMDVLLQRYRVRGGSLPRGGPRNGRRGMQAQLIRVRYRERQRRRLLLPELGRRRSTSPRCRIHVGAWPGSEDEVGEAV